MIFVNVSDAAQNVEFDFDGKRYWGEEPPFVTMTQRTESGAEEPVREQPKFARKVRLSPQEAVAFEISAGK